jgi:hypothetical protein
MSKTWILILFLLVDLMGIGSLYYGYCESRLVLYNIAHLADYISFQNRIGFFAAGLFIPILHASMCCFHFWPAYTKKRYNIIVERSIVILIIILLAFGILFSTCMMYYVESAGYRYCASASGSGTFFKTLVYTKDDAVCLQLADK